MTPISLFGTDGIRASADSHILAPNSVRKIGWSIAQWFHATHGSIPRCLLIHDGRRSGPNIVNNLTIGITAAGGTCTFGGILPTPAASVLLQTYSADIGIIVSASHNPPSDNGIKIITQQFGKLSQEDEAAIASFYACAPHDYTTQPTYTTLDDAEARYIHFFERYIPHTPSLKIVVDCANGATSTVAPVILSQTGATIIPINNAPTGDNCNVHCGATCPDTMQSAVLAHSADLGIAFDGDGDRLIACAADGRIIDGDDILWLLTQHPAYQAERLVAGTIMSNEGLAHALNEHGIQLHRTPVGDKHIIAALTQHENALGGEPSGHIIMRDCLTTGDGILTALRLIDTMAQTNNYALKTFEKYPQFHAKIAVTQKIALDDPDIAAAINTAQTALTHGRMIVRYSGTEPILRVMLEGNPTLNIQEIGTNLVTHLKTILERASA